MLQFSLLLWTVAALTLSGCGTEGNDEHKLEPEDIVHPTSEEIQQGLVKINSYLVAFKSTAGSEQDYASHNLVFRDHFSLLADDESDPGVASMNFITALNMNPAQNLSADEQNFGPSLVSHFATKPYYATAAVASLTEVNFRSATDARRILQEWLERDRIWYAEPNYASKPFQTTTASPWSTYATSYEKISGYWHKSINTAAAFNALAAIPEATSDRPIIAVMDSGLDIEHPDIKANLWLNDSPGEAGCGSDDLYGCNATAARNGVLGNGDIHPSKVEGFNQVCPVLKGKCDKDCCHGTHVAGIIAATPTRKIGGVCPICRIMTVRVVGKAAGTIAGGESYTILDAWISAGLTYVSSFKRGSPVRILNASLGQSRRSRSIAIQVAALANSTGTSGTLVIGAAGNEDSNRVQYPAGYEDAISVANLNAANNKSESSNFGSWVDIAAPGFDITSSIPGGEVEEKTGTSMAAPFVSGIAGLIVAAYPNISTQELRNRILGAGDPGIYSTALNQSYLVKVPTQASAIPLLGSGLIKADVALKAGNPKPILRPTERVGRGCGNLGIATERAYLSLLLLVMVLPILCIYPKNLFPFK